jgi:hypothetical protein
VSPRKHVLLQSKSLHYEQPQRAATDCQPGSLPRCGGWAATRMKQLYSISRRKSRPLSRADGRASGAAISPLPAKIQAGGQPTLLPEATSCQIPIRSASRKLAPSPATRQAKDGHGTISPHATRPFALWAASCQNAALRLVGDGWSFPAAHCRAARQWHPKTVAPAAACNMAIHKISRGFALHRGDSQPVLFIRPFFGRKSHRVIPGV